MSYKKNEPEKRSVLILLGFLLAAILVVYTVAVGLGKQHKG